MHTANTTVFLFLSQTSVLRVKNNYVSELEGAKLPLCKVAV